MVIDKKREKFIDGFLLGDISNGNRELHKFFLKECPSGKLYKYRAINKYSIADIENNTMYCSDPRNFNDPFDCKVGIEILDLFKNKFENDISLFENVVEKYTSILQNIPDVKYDSAEEERIISKLLKDKKLSNDYIRIFESANYGECDSDIAKDYIVRLFRKVFNDKYFKNTFGFATRLLPDFFDKAFDEKLLEEELTAENLAKIHGIIDEGDDFELLTKVYSKLFPDTENAFNKLKTDIIHLIDSLVDSILSKFRIICLTADVKNILMWSHYADSHRGICIEYDYSDYDSIPYSEVPYPVLYSEKRIVVNANDMPKDKSGNHEKLNYKLIKGLITKSNSWEYENEWRLLLSEKVGENLIMPRISAIYLGALVSDEDKTLISEIAKKNSIPVKQMKIDRVGYKLYIE
ncbi:MAG: DUF2971 domain-containing protein [Lachnospiraceae bacterium]|nr:DUF2971 domain-containing protein [Lachnospiraceae bacterium]